MRRGRGRLRAAAAAVAIRARTSPGDPAGDLEVASGPSSRRSRVSRIRTSFVPDAQMCRLMARAIVDQADTIAVLRQSTAWVMWMQTTQPSLVPTLSATAALWKEKVSDDTSELFGLGLRLALIWSLLRTLRITLESPSAELLSDARERKWIDLKLATMDIKHTTPKKLISC